MSDRFENSALQQWQAAASNPAAPAGQQQAAAAAAGYASGDSRFEDSALGKWTAEQGFTATSPSWYTGFNAEGTANGWNTDFVKQYQASWDKALAEETADDFFSNDDATGVVTWDHTSKDGETKFEFGDIYSGGKLVGNVFEMYEGQDAYLSMLPWLDIDGAGQRRLFESDDPVAAVKGFVEESRKANNAHAEQVAASQEFQGRVDESREELQEGGGDEALGIVGGGLGGAATGAGTGAALTAWLGPGAAAGAVGGGLIGGAIGAVGGYLNRDELAEQAARAKEIIEVSFEENNDIAAVGTSLQQGAGLAMSLSSPLKNVTHGTYDALAKGSETGDGESAFYALDDKGEAKAPAWMKAVSLTAAVGDGLLQFASPAARALYTANMSAHIGGSVTELAFSGSKFDPREGRFDNVFLNDEGGADPASGLAAIGMVGIDAVQLAGWRGLARQATSGRRAADQMQESTELAGMRFFRDEAGELQKKRTLALLAPSEQVAYWTAARQARVKVLKDYQAGKRTDTVVTADDFYRAANDLANGSNRLKTAMVNGFGEGYEEVAQAVLEPMALDGELSRGVITDAWLYGVAGGVGMSMGATFGAASNDQRMMSQAYVLETLRQGAEPDPEQFKADWAARTDTEKRVMASRSKADVELTRSALDKIAKDHAATRVANEPDTAKAMDAHRSFLERELKSGSEFRTDQFIVMSGRLDAGRVNERGERTEGLSAEALEASVATIYKLLDNKRRGLTLQAQTLTDRLTQLQAAEQTEEVAAKIAEANELLATIRRAASFGDALLEDVGRIVDEIYDEDTTEVQAERLTGQLNTLLEQVFTRRANLAMPEEFEGTAEELADAAAQFVTLLHSREPKLDTGSYLALLPQASWDLTFSRSDNFVQVNTDVLQAINGDFDGDKLRAEYQLILTKDRYLQARAGQFFGGAGDSIDVAERNFDEALTAAVAAGLDAAPGEVLHDEANGVMSAITTAITGRYGDLMSAEAMARVLEEFRLQVRAGSGEARLTLMNALAREAGEGITNLGKSELRNEWLWIASVVRANFSGYQNAYRAARVADAAGPSETIDPEVFDTPEGTTLRKQRAVVEAQTLAAWALGNTQFRKKQKVHYTVLNAAVLSASTLEPNDMRQLARLYEELGRGITRSELANATAHDTIAARVLVMLDRAVDDMLADPELRGKYDRTTARTILANVRVKNVWMEGSAPTTDNQGISLVQLLMRRALEADREEHARTFASDPKLQAKHSRLFAMTLPNEGSESRNAEKAFLEVFGAIPFGEALGGVIGNLPPHVTPEQWLRNYESLDAEGRRAMEREYTGVPEYLDRKDTSNPPYSVHEADRGEVTPYRSMLDAMIAVGRNRITFDPRAKKTEDVFGGDRWLVSEAAMNDFREVHREVQNAARTFRQGANRRSSKRAVTADLIQEMFEANPMQARQILDLLPDAASASIYEYRDGELYVADWFYEMLAEPKPEKALFGYWKNLTLAQWWATLDKSREADGAVAGRAYHKLQSRFQRLMYQLSLEPGQAHLEQLIRKMHDSSDIVEFFRWLNHTPGYRGQQAPLLPFNDDVADFEADAGGGWMGAKAGTELRESLAKAKVAAKQMSEQVAFREATEAVDSNLLRGIKKAAAGDPSATADDRANLRKLAKAVAMSRQLPRGFAPTAMLALSQGVMRDYDPQSHDKGRAPTSYEAVGEFQALMDAFGFVPGLERVMEVLTAHSLSSLQTNLGDVAKDGGTAMDAHGRQVEWERMTLEQAIEMLDDPKARPLALALLTPSALDVTATGSLTERPLIEPSLKGLVEGDYYKELFREPEEGEELEQAVRYVSMLDSRARIEGGSFDAMRAVHDRAIALTSGLGRPATDEDLLRFRNQAYVEVARVLKMVGRVQATPSMRNAATLQGLRDSAVEVLRQQRLSRTLPSFVDRKSGKVATEWLDAVLVDLRAEHDELQRSLAELYTGIELDNRSAALTEQYDANEKRLRRMVESDALSGLLDRFEVSSPDAALDDVTRDAADAAARVQIVNYVRSMASFPSRAPEAAGAWSKLMTQLEDGHTPKLSAKEWDLLSRAAMGLTQTDEVLRVASHVTLPPFPKGDPAVSDARFIKYFDPTFSYLATDLLDPDSPLTAAAAWLHTAAEQEIGEVALSKLTNVLNRTMLAREQLGTWTPGLMSHLTEVHMRMDSAAAPGAIAAAGNGPKRMAALALATRRSSSKRVPGPEHLTTVTFSSELLDPAALYEEIPVTPAGSAEEISMPMAQLDNRFVASLKIGGVEISLAEHNLGYHWDGEPEESGLRYVALERLRQVVNRNVASYGAPVEVEIEFVHPDSQPAGAEWMNNAFFEGMSHHLLPDGNESLIGTLWSDNGGRISAATQWPLDAGKKGLRAMQPFRRPNEAALAEADELWKVGNDFAAMLRAKTRIAMTYDDGSGPVDPAYYNAVYKHMKLAHVVVGTLDGEQVVLTAEQVIAHQAANGVSSPLPLTDAKLVELSPDVLRSMLGDTSTQAADRFFAEEFLLNPDMVPAYTGITQTMVERFGAGWFAETGAVADTRLRHVAMQRTLRVRSVIPTAERDKREARRIYLDNRNGQVVAERAAKLKGRKLKKDFVAALQVVRGQVEAERSTFDFAAANAGMIAPRSMSDSDQSQQVAKALAGTATDTGYQRAWNIVDEGGPNYPGGVLTVESLDESRGLEHQVVKGDLAVVQLDSFDRPERNDEVVEQRLEQALQYLTETGTNIAIVSDGGAADTRWFASELLEQMGYRRIAGSKHLWGPVEFSHQTQNERAYESTLLETQRIRPARSVITFLTSDPVGIDENAAALNPASMKLRDRRPLKNLLPSSAFANYNVPLDTNDTTGFYDRALAHARTVTDPLQPEHREMLLEMAGKDPHGAMPIETALDRFHARITRSATLAPQPGDEIQVGDIIPFVHPSGRVLFYRHGFKLPKPEQMDKLLGTRGMNVALASSELEAGLTANSGIITAIENRAGYGRTLFLETELQPYGDKIQLEWNGMKYVVVPPGKELPAFQQIFGNGTRADLLADLASANSKEAFEGRVWNYRNALAFFQYDFTDDMVEFFYPDAATRPADARVLTYELLHQLATQTDVRLPLTDAAALSRAQTAVADLIGDFARAAAPTSVPADWVERFDSGAETATDQIARAVITYLLTPHAEVDNVLKSAGFSHKDAAHDSVWTRKVPGLFADLLDQGMDSALHAELIDRFDAQLHRGPNGEGFKLHRDWRVEQFDGKGGSIRGYLQFGEAHSSGDNPLLDGQAFDSSNPQPVSDHNALAAALSVGAITAHKLLKKTRSATRAFASGNVENVWTALTALPDEKDALGAGWRRETGAETLRRARAREEIVGLYQPIDTAVYGDDVALKYEEIARVTLDKLNLYGYPRAMFDTWVRDHLGRPYALDEAGNDKSAISPDDLLQVAREIRQNVNQNLLPHAGANIPLIDINQYTAIYMANLNRGDDAWAPRTSLDRNSELANSWDAWVDVAFGTAWDGDPLFDQMYTLAVDGRMHGYQGATTSTRYLPVSSNILIQRGLMDEKTQQRLVSISADENLLATDPTLFNAEAAALEDIIAGDRIYGPGRGGPDPSSAKGRQRKRIERWRKETDAPTPAVGRARGIRAGGQTFLGHTTETSAFWRSMMNLRVGNTLFNISLIVAAPIDAAWRRQIDTFSNLLTGESIGAAGRLQARLSEALPKPVQKVAELLGVQPTYTHKQLKDLQNLVHAVSTRPEFRAMVYKELMYQYPSMPGIGKVEKWLERYAKFGARIQDPSWGMPPHDLARIYLSTVLRKVSQMPTGSDVYSIDRLIAGMARNPEWLRENDLEAHNMAIAAISQIRSVKPNVLSLAVRGLIEPMSRNPSIMVNSVGNTLKIFTAFQNFWSNFIVSATGLQGAADWVAFVKDGKQKRIVGRMQAAIGGKPYEAAAEDFYDMSEVLESLDLADSFIRGGVTHTALFTLGMLAQGLGLSGEDEEMKWRRRQAELQGVPVFRDPRDIVNDYRNTDTLYLDWLPFGLDSLFRSEEGAPAVAQMNWITRSLLSPIIGFERFYNTGDFSEVIHGFKDAVGAHPIVNAQLWNEATDTAAMLHQTAMERTEAGDPVEGGRFLITAVGVLERMLFENSMVNMIYVGADRYDRDPYLQPKLDSDGNRQGDVRGNPYGTDALQPVVSDDMEQIEAYIKRDDFGATVRTFTENRFTAALFGSIYTGVTGGDFNSDMWRRNMAIKTKKVELSPGEPNEFADAVLATFLQSGGQGMLTESEAAQIVWNAKPEDEFWSAEVVEKQAAAMVANQEMVGLSLIDADGREQITKAGLRAVFEGLRKNAVTLGDQSLNGIYATPEQRDEIRDEWMADLVNEGKALGLTHDQATWRMRRIFFGDQSNADAPALIDLLYTDLIPRSDQLEYNQLNTTYVTGPNGWPMATGFKRDGFFGALGLKPFKRLWDTPQMGMDSRGNAQDMVAGINTGLRALEPRPESWEIPTTEEEIRAAAEKVADAIENLEFPKLGDEKGDGSGSGSGWRNFGRGGGGGYGGYSSGGYADFEKMYALPRGITVYGNTIPFINTSNPIIRRADVRRERVWSERGRLNQWQ